MATLVPTTRRAHGAFPGERLPAAPDDAADDGVPNVRRASWALPAVPPSTSRARRLVRAALRDWAGTAEDEDEGGRGLLIVESLSRAWGVRPTSRGKAVWFELAVRC